MQRIYSSHIDNRIKYINGEPALVRIGILQFCTCQNNIIRVLHLPELQLRILPMTVYS